MIHEKNQETLNHILLPETGAYWGYGKEENMQSSESYQMSWKFPYS